MLPVLLSYAFLLSHAMMFVTRYKFPDGKDVEALNNGITELLFCIE